MDTKTVAMHPTLKSFRTVCLASTAPRNSFERDTTFVDLNAVAMHHPLRKPRLSGFYRGGNTLFTLYHDQRPFLLEMILPPLPFQLTSPPLQGYLAHEKPPPRRTLL